MMDLDELTDIIKGIDRSKVDELSELLKDRNRIYLIGNGGSNAICSHLSQDYTKALGYKAECFSDGSRLTCYINDYGRDSAYAKYVEHFATPEDLVILISSSGNSDNIIRAAEYCVTFNIPFLILTGFDKNNKLRTFRKIALLDFHVPSCDYGIVENVHSIFLHSVI